MHLGFNRVLTKSLLASNYNVYSIFGRLRCEYPRELIQSQQWALTEIEILQSLLGNLISGEIDFPELEPLGINVSECVFVLFLYSFFENTDILLRFDFYGEDGTDIVA